jgi:tetratricopeptide (TPR) repeat protein
MKLGFLLAMRGDPEAERWCRRAIALLEAEIAAGRNGDWPLSMMGETHSVLGRFLASKGRNGEAVDAFRRAVDSLGTLLRTHPSVPAYTECLNVALFGLSGSLASGGQTGEAVDVYRRGIELMSVPTRGFDEPAEVPSAGSWPPPFMLRALGPLSRSLRTAGKVADAERVERQSLAALDALALGYAGRPAYLRKLAEGYLSLGNVLAGAGDGQGARAAWRKALQRTPDGASARNNLAWLAATCSDPEIRDPRRAVELARKAVEQAPDDGTYWNTLGVSYYRAGDPKAAVTALEKSMHLRKGGDAFDWFFLAMAHWQLGDQAEARTWYDKAVGWMKGQTANEELTRFRTEAAALLEVNGKKD